MKPTWSARILGAATYPLGLTPAEEEALLAEQASGRVSPDWLEAWRYRWRLCAFAVGTAPTSCEACGRELDQDRRSDARSCDRACAARARRALASDCLPVHTARVALYRETLSSLRRELDLIVSYQDPGFAEGIKPRGRT